MYSEQKQIDFLDKQFQQERQNITKSGGINMKENVKLLPRLILGIGGGILTGFLANTLEAYSMIRVMSTFTGIFGNFLSFFIPFIILGFVAPGIADLGKQAGKLLGVTVGIAYVSTVVAGILAFIAGSALLPHFIKAGEIANKSEINIAPYFTIEMPPVMGIMSALITAFILGLGMSYIKGKNLLNALQDFQQIVQLVVKFIIIPFVPIHIAGIFAKLTASGEMFQTLKAFSSIMIMIIILQIIYILIQYTISWTLNKRNPFTSLKNMLPAYFTALGTQSSAATIPVTLQSVRNNEVSEDIVDFVIPLCATIHLAGDTITLVLASMGVMMMDGIIPSFGTMLPFILMLGITMVAAPGIPGGGVYAALGLLKDMLLFTAPQQGLMIALHLAQDSFGTATNVTGDGAIAMIMDRIARKKK